MKEYTTLTVYEHHQLGSLVSGSDVQRLINNYRQDLDRKEKRIAELESELFDRESRMNEYLIQIDQLEAENSKLNHRIYEHNCRLIGAPIPPKEQD